MILIIIIITLCNYLAGNYKGVFRDDSLQICIPFSIMPSFTSEEEITTAGILVSQSVSEGLNAHSTSGWPLVNLHKSPSHSKA